MTVDIPLGPETEEPLFCMACLCWSDNGEKPMGPAEDCANPVCSCHQPYWDTIPESLKRELWGK